MKFYNEENILKKLISEFEGMSQKGVVGFYEKTVWLDFILYYENQSNFEKGIELCDLAMSQHVSSMEFLFHKSRLLVELKELSKALDCIENALSFSPENFDLNFLRAEIWVELGEFRWAYDTLKKLYKTSGLEYQSQIILLLAKIYEINEDFVKMFSVLKKALRKDPDNPLLLSRVWFAAELSQLYQESIELHLELIELTPYSFLAWYNLGQAYICLEDYKKAAEAFEYVYIINDQFELGYKDAAEAYIMIEDYEKALSIYNEYLEILEPDSDVFAKVGLCQEKLGNIGLAKEFYLQALEANPFNSMALFRMGECHMREESWGKAIHFYNRAIESDCNREDYLIAIAQAYFKNKNIKQAKKFFQKATDMAPELSKYWTEYATFLMKMGKSEEAYSILDEAYFYTVDTEVLYCKAACLFAMSKRKEALKTLTQALEENASLLESLFTLTPELVDDSEVRALINTFK